MKNPLAKSSTADSDLIWSEVKKAAEATPNWVKANIREASRTRIERISQEDEAGGPAKAADS